LPGTVKRSQSMRPRQRRSVGFGASRRDRSVTVTRMPMFDERLGSEARARVDTPGDVWAVVLAGGEGIRLRPLTRLIYGAERPKQYAALLGPRSLLRQTLDRVRLAFAPERTIVVTVRNHAGYMADEFCGHASPRVLVQPESRGTAAGVLFPAHWVQWHDPEATVAVFPSDHFVPAEALFMKHVLGAARFVRQHPSWMVLLGARATQPQPEYGWIEPGEVVARTEAGPLFRVVRFWEKPSPDMARLCLERGCFWNTFVLVARASTMVTAGRDYLPTLHARLAQIAPFAGSKDEEWAIRTAYAMAPTASFSRAVLEPCPPWLAVSPLPAMEWSDCGTAERVMQCLRRAGISPAWLEALPHPA
jgi:mannose-1-phosphate guanylyltransferase